MQSGLTALTCAPLLISCPALAAVIWRDTPALSFQFTQPGNTAELPVDIDLDGTSDFVLAGQSPLPGSPEFWGAAVLGLATSRVAAYWVDVPGETGLARRFAAGELIGEGLSAPRGIPISYFEPYGATPEQLLYAWGFEGATTGYVGIQLVSPSDGLTRYGWLEMTTVFARTPTSLSVSISRVAWETTPGEPIGAGLVPAPGAGLLCLVPWLRRRRK